VFLLIEQHFVQDYLLYYTHCVPSKRWYLPISPHCFTTQNNKVHIFIVVRASNLNFVYVQLMRNAFLRNHTSLLWRLMQQIFVTVQWTI